MFLLMVHLPTLENQREYFQKNEEEILNSGHRFAVVETNSVNYFDNSEELYKEHPYFCPGSEPIYGTLPMFIDIGKLTNSLEYREERLIKDNANLEKKASELSERRKELEKEKYWMYL